MPTAKQTAIANLLAKSVKKYDLSAGSLSEIAIPTKFISTGNLAIDYIIGGGIPLGRSTELSGLSSSGKSTTALQAAANMQKIILSGGDPELGIGADDFILYMDYEGTIDAEYALALGLDIEDSTFILTQPETLEQGANFAREAIETGAIRMVIWDSVASMLPSSKAEAEIGKSLPAVQAKLMSDFSQLLNPLLLKHNTANVWINHLKEIMAMGPQRPGIGPRMGTPGGAAMKFYASVRVEYRQLAKVTEERIDDLTQQPRKEVIAQNVLIKVTKNKVSKPFREAVARVRFGTGFDNFWTALQVLIAYKEVMYGTGMFKFHKVPQLAPDWMARAQTGTKQPYIKGEKNIFTAADEHPEWRDAVIAHAVQILSVGDDKLKELAARELDPEDMEALEPKPEGGVLTDEEVDELIS
jgi:recombination protein RecA